MMAALTSRLLPLLAVALLLAACPGAMQGADCGGQVCLPGQGCVNGHCLAGTCSTGGGACVDTTSDLLNCGSCGSACGAAADTCKAGSCLCGGGVTCGEGRICCVGLCQVPAGDGSCPPPPDAALPLDLGDLGPLPDGPLLPPGDGPHPPDNGTVDLPAAAPDKGPTCGDSSCNKAAGETCVSCPLDCGVCPCQPSQQKKDTSACGPCQERISNCDKTGQWGPWGQCYNLCTPAQLCLNNTCAECTPGTQKSGACPCGTREAFCDGAGKWGNWGSCQLTCGNG